MVWATTVALAWGIAGRWTARTRWSGWPCSTSIPPLEDVRRLEPHSPPVTGAGCSACSRICRASRGSASAVSRVLSSAVDLQPPWTATADALAAMSVVLPPGCPAREPRRLPRPGGAPLSTTSTPPRPTPDHAVAGAVGFRGAARPAYRRWRSGVTTRTHVTGAETPECGHFMAEERPEALLASAAFLPVRRAGEQPRCRRCRMTRHTWVDDRLRGGPAVTATAAPGPGSIATW